MLPAAVGLVVAPDGRGAHWQEARCYEVYLGCDAADIDVSEDDL